MEVKKNKNSKVFAKGFCFKKMFFIFIIGSIFGAYYEEIIVFITKIFNNEPLIWEPRRGVLWGPLSPIYGFGAVAMSYALAKKERPLWKTFLYAAIIGGIVEFGIGFLQETFIGTVSWNYSNSFLNIQGRTSLKYMIVWGFLGVAFVKWIYPFVSSLIEKIPINIGNSLYTILLIVVLIDCLISWTALGRQTLRRKGHEPFTVIGEFYDKNFNDNYLKSKFPTMVLKN